MKLIQKIPPFLRNKYLLASLAFLAWLLFFDRNDLLVQQERKRELETLQQSKRYYQQEIEKERRFAEDLRNNPAVIERFARERYLMKREQEDLFLVETDSTQKQ